jgi:hypothetical protein
VDDHDPEQHHQIGGRVKTVSRRNFISGLFVAPAIIPAQHLMRLSIVSPELLTIRSPYELLYPGSPEPLKFEISKTMVAARARHLSANWTFEKAQDMICWIDDDLEAELAKELRAAVECWQQDNKN